MPYKDPEKRRVVSRDSKRRLRAREAHERSDRVVADVAAGAFRGLPAPPDHDELVRLLGIAARGGSVRAIEVLLRRDAVAAAAVFDPFGEFAALDELACRRDDRPARRGVSVTSRTDPEVKGI